jgi:hypothetical protein
MTPTERDPIPQPTDQSGGDVPGIEADASLDADTEGHSLMDGELARSINLDRAREATKRNRDSALARDAKGTDRGGFFKRLGRR